MALQEDRQTRSSSRFLVRKLLIPVLLGVATLWAVAALFALFCLVLVPQAPVAAVEALVANHQQRQPRLLGQAQAIVARVRPIH